MTYRRPPSEENNKSNNSSVSHFQKTVCLHDWWLIMAEEDCQGKRLGVAGFTSREKQAVRAFSSAPILKIYDVFTLETVDGIIVLIKGFINKLRTTENGFPSEVGNPSDLRFLDALSLCCGERNKVFNHFVFGFPPYWEKCVEKCLEERSINEDVSSTIRREKLPAASGSADDFCKGTPSRKIMAVCKRQRNNCQKMDVNEAGEKGKNTDRVLRSSSGLDANQIDGLHTEVRKKETKAEEASKSEKITRRKLRYGSPLAQGATDETSVSPEFLSLKKSRSGRVLLPALEFWRNQKAVYDKDRKLTGIQEALHNTNLQSGSRSETQRKRKLIL